MMMVVMMIIDACLGCSARHTVAFSIRDLVAVQGARTVAFSIIRDLVAVQGLKFGNLDLCSLMQY